MKKTQLLSVVTRRQKGSVIDDIRPSPAQTVSSDLGTSLTPGTGGGGLDPDCTTIIAEPPVPPCGDEYSKFPGEDIVLGWGGASGSLSWHYHNFEPLPSIEAFAVEEALARYTGNTTAYIGGGTGVLTAVPLSIGDGSSYGGAIVSAKVNYKDVSDKMTVKYRLYWSDIGGLSENSTQHALNFTARAPDIESGTANRNRLYGDTPPAGSVYDFRWARYYQLRIVWNEGPVRFPAGSYLQAANQASVAIPDIEQGVDYFFKITTEPTYVTGSLWKADEDESTAYSATWNIPPDNPNAGYPPNLQVFLAQNNQPPFDHDPNRMKATVNFKSVIVNEIPGGASDDCGENEPGFYRATLYKSQNFWRIYETEVTYGQVWFDGIAVTEGIHYNIEDGYKIVPTSILDADTLVEAEVTINA